MSKVPIEIDDELLEEARQELGTATKKDTVNEALRIVVLRRRRLRQQVAEANGAEENPYIHLGIGSDAFDPEIMSQARR